MLDRMRTALVESYVGVIVVGWLLADGLVRFTGIFSSPILSWETRRAFASMTPSVAGPQPFAFQVSLPDVIASALLLLIGYGLLRWLYYPRAEREASEHAEAVQS